MVVLPLLAYPPPPMSSVTILDSLPGVLVWAPPIKWQQSRMPHYFAVEPEQLSSTVYLTVLVLRLLKTAFVA